MNLADEMSQLTKEYEDKFFDPELFKYIISLIRKAAQRGEHSLLFYVSGTSEMYSSLVRHLRSEGFIAIYMYGPAYDDGTPSKNYIDISWR